MSPLERGKSTKTRGENISRLMKEYGKSGKIGRITPRDAEHAKEIAAAIGQRIQRDSLRGKQ